jgi:hypothetical protein
LDFVATALLIETASINPNSAIAKIATSQLKHITGIHIPKGESFLHVWIDLYLTHRFGSGVNIGFGLVVLPQNRPINIMFTDGRQQRQPNHNTTTSCVYWR